MPHSEIEHLLALLDEAYSRAAWHRPNLRGSIRGVTAREAGIPPKAGRNTIWEIVLHAAYWKYTVWRRLLGEKRGSFSIQGSNWFDRPIDRSETAWRADVALLESEHRRLREAVSAFQPEDLERPARGSQNCGAAIDHRHCLSRRLSRWADSIDQKTSKDQEFALGARFDALLRA